MKLTYKRWFAEAFTIKKKFRIYQAIIVTYVLLGNIENVTHCLALGLNFTVGPKGDIRGIRWPLFLVPLFKEPIRPSLMNKNTFMGVVGSIAICQGAWKKSWPPVHLVIGRQTSVWAVKPTGAANLLQAFSATVGKTWRGLTWAETYVCKRDCASPAFLAAESSMALEQIPPLPKQIWLYWKQRK